jgi:hypothetical protein
LRCRYVQFAKRDSAPVPAALAFGHATAEWLVLKDGTNIAIKGPWKVRGRNVQFTTTTGQLQMLPLDDVDIALSEAVSKNAKEDTGWQEVKSTPQAVIEEKGGDSYYVARTSRGAVAVRASSGWYQYNGTDGGAQCIPATPIAASDAGELVVQVGTQIERVRIIGAANPSPQAIRAAAVEGGGQVCLEQEENALRHNDKGQFESYVWLADGRDLGFELIRAGAAKIAEKPFTRRAEYQSGRLRTSGPAMAGNSWTPQMSRYAPPPDTSLVAWIQDPNAPRVSGTLSSPGLRLSAEDLLREGREILKDPQAIAAGLQSEYDATYGAYTSCMDMARGPDDRAACTASYNTGAQSVRERAERAAAAVTLARREAQVQGSEDAAAMQEVERYLSGKDESKSEPQKVTVEVVVKDAEGKETGRSSTAETKTEKPPRD